MSGGSPSAASIAMRVRRPRQRTTRCRSATSGRAQLDHGQAHRTRAIRDTHASRCSWDHLDYVVVGALADEPARPIATTLRDAVPEPGQHDGGGLPEAGGDVDEHRLARAAGTQPVIVAACKAFAACEPCLVLVVLVRTKPCCSRKQVIEPPGQDRNPITPPPARWQSPTAARRPVSWRPPPASRYRRR